MILRSLLKSTDTYMPNGNIFLYVNKSQYCTSNTLTILEEANVVAGKNSQVRNAWISCPRTQVLSPAPQSFLRTTLKTLIMTRWSCQSPEVSGSSAILLRIEPYSLINLVSLIPRYLEDHPHPSTPTGKKKKKEMEIVEVGRFVRKRWFPG